MAPGRYFSQYSLMYSSDLVDLGGGQVRRFSRRLRERHVPNFQTQTVRGAHVHSLSSRDASPLPPNENKNENKRKQIGAGVGGRGVVWLPQASAFPSLPFHTSAPTTAASSCPSIPTASCIPPTPWQAHTSSLQPLFRPRRRLCASRLSRHNDPQHAEARAVTARATSQPSRFSTTTRVLTPTPRRSKERRLATHPRARCGQSASTTRDARRSPELTQSSISVGPRLQVHLGAMQ